MSARHTSGPWKARFEKVRYVIFVDGEIGEKALATTGGAYPDSQANALLIASAPDLLEALQGLEDSGILGTAESNASGNPNWEFVSKHISAARAAIAKALGEQA